MFNDLVEKLKLKDGVEADAENTGLFCYYWSSKKLNIGNFQFLNNNENKTNVYKLQL